MTKRPGKPSVPGMPSDPRSPGSPAELDIKKEERLNDQASPKK